MQKIDIQRLKVMDTYKDDLEIPDCCVVAFLFVPDAVVWSIHPFWPGHCLSLIGKTIILQMIRTELSQESTISF